MRLADRSKDLSAFIQVLNQEQQMLCLLLGEPLQFLKQGFGSGRGRTIIVEKFLGADVEIFADIDESGERGEGAPVFNFINITLALAEREAHIPRRNAALNPQLGQAVIKPFNIVKRCQFI